MRTIAIKDPDGKYWLKFFDAPKIGGSNIRLLAMQISEDELTENEKKNIEIANVFGSRSEDEIKKMLGDHRICELVYDGGME